MKIIAVGKRPKGTLAGGFLHAPLKAIRASATSFHIKKLFFKKTVFLHLNIPPFILN